MMLVAHANASRSARLAAKKHCDEHDLQLLDQNVVLQSMWPCRSNQQLLAVKRVYRFEFSSVGDYRYRGSITMVSNRVEGIELAPYKSRDA